MRATGATLQVIGQTAAGQVGAVVLSPHELEDRLGTAFAVELLERILTSVDDPGMRRLGLRDVAATG